MIYRSSLSFKNFPFFQIPFMSVCARLKGVFRDLLCHCTCYMWGQRSPLNPWKAVFMGSGTGELFRVQETHISRSRLVNDDLSDCQMLDFNNAAPRRREVKILFMDSSFLLADLF